MKTFIATVGRGKGTWGYVGRLMQEEWDKIILIGNEWTKERFSHEKDAQWIEINSQDSIGSMVETIEKNLDDVENVHLNFVSGSGNEHMALLIALTHKEIDYSFCYLTKEGVKME